jgi:hypothetical protein
MATLMQKVLELQAVVANRSRALVAMKDELMCKENIAVEAEMATVMSVTARTANAKRTVNVMESLLVILKSKDSSDELVPVAARMLMDELADVTKKTEESAVAVHAAVAASARAESVLPKLRSDANVLIRSLNEALGAREKCLRNLSPAGTGANSVRAVPMQSLLDVTRFVQNVPLCDEACVAASVDLRDRLIRDMDAKQQVLDRTYADEHRQAAENALQLVQHLAATRERVAVSAKSSVEISRECEVKSKGLVCFTERTRVALVESTRSVDLEAEAQLELDRFSCRYRVAVEEAMTATEVAVVAVDRFSGHLPGWMADTGLAEGAGAVAIAVSSVIEDVASVLLGVKSAADAIVAVEDLGDWQDECLNVTCRIGVDEDVFVEYDEAEVAYPVTVAIAVPFREDPPLAAGEYFELACARALCQGVCTRDPAQAMGFICRVCASSFQSSQSATWLR